MRTNQITCVWPLIVVVVTLGLAAASANAVLINTVNSDGARLSDTNGNGNPFDLENTPYTLSFDAGATADMLIVQLSSEAGSGGSTSGISITYDGVALAPAILSGSRARGIWYLDNPFTGGSADLTVDMSNFGVVNGLGLGVVSVATDASGIALHSTASASGKSVTINTTLDDGFIVTGYASNGGGAITLPGGHASLYNGGIGSTHAAAGHIINNVAAGSHTFTYTDTNTNPNDAKNVLAVAFVAVPEPATLSLLALSGLAMLGRRRRAMQLKGRDS